jgi:hypothetical protein
VAELSGLSVDFQTLAVEIQEGMRNESDLLSVSFPDQTIVLLANTLAGGLAMLNYSQLTANLNNFLPFSFLKTAGFAIAATLGVAPRRKAGAQMQALLRPPGTQAAFSGQLDAIITLPQFTRFRCRNKYWHTRRSYLLHPNDTQLEIQLYEGQVLVEEFRGLGEKYQRWYIGSQFNVDNNTIRVMIDEDWWSEADNSFVYYTPRDQVFLQQTSPDGKVLVFFGNGIYGKVPAKDSTIRIFYTVTAGSDSNSSSTGDDVQLLESITIGPNRSLAVDGISTTPAIGGEDEHSLDDIKYAIPRLYAANQRAVRRDDYIGHLLGPKAPIIFADARVWGEYEQALKEGVGKLTMMNRAYWTGILRSRFLTENISVSTAIPGGQQSFTVTIPPPTQSIIPGSLIVTNSNDSITFNDLEGNGILVSDDVSFNAFGAGTPSAQNTQGGSAVGRIVDANIETYWQSLTAPTVADPVRVSYDFGLGTSRTPKSFRLRSSNDPSREARSFPRQVSFWGSNVVSPGLTNDVNWTVLRGRVYISDPGIATWSQWITIPNDQAFRHVMIKIEDKWGNSASTKVCEWQIQSTENTSWIDYRTLQFHVIWPQALPSGTVLGCSYYGPDLTDLQQLEISNFLHGGEGHQKPLNHFTTDITYKSPIMRRVVVEVEIYYFSEYNESAVQEKVESAISDLFRVRMGSINRKITNADLMRTVISLREVDYAVFIKPGLGSDLIPGLGEFLQLDNIEIDMIISDRGT